MTKKNKAKNSPPVNHAATKPASTDQTGIGKPPSLLDNMLATTKYIAPELGNLDLDWDEDAFTRLDAALSDDGRTTFASLLGQFCAMGKGLKGLQTAYAAQSKALEAQKTAQDSLDMLLSQRVAEMDAKQKVLSEQAMALATQSKDIAAREANAYAGFVKEQQLALQQAQNELSELETQRHELKLELRSQRITERESIESERSELFKQFDEREAQLDQRVSALRLEQERIDRAGRSLKADWHTRSELEAQVRAEQAEEHAAAIASNAVALKKCQDRLAKAEKGLDQANEQLDGFSDIKRVLGDKAPSTLLEDGNDLRRQLKEMKNRIAELEAAQMRDDYDAITQERDRLKEELGLLRPELEEFKQGAHEYRLGVMERERWAREKRALEMSKQLQEGHLNDLETRIRGLTDAQQAQSAFPELTKMDQGVYQLADATEKVSDLKQFTEELQHRIVASQPDNPLFFRLTDLQLFMGGLAMSQLHIFQGISGTGKTSLAKAFAAAVGGECTDIAVQAGWRDRDDLLGHYNAFEKRYYEKDSLQALYKAQTPKASDRINIILLDEMNLSRPEHYFAEFLSALEMGPNARWISLMESPPSKWPVSLKDGRYIKIPENVWFIGTANHDETTNEFADKTHDRAFVLELPRHEERFKPKYDLKQARYSFESMRKAFLAAEKEYQKEVAEILAFVAKSKLTDVLEKKFGLGWGNRFERQAAKFLPVVKAAGGSFGLALDHLLASRMFRTGKVTGRYDTRIDDLNEIESALVDLATGSLSDFDAARCLQAIEKDRRRFERSA